MAKSHYHCYNESNVDSSHHDTRHHTVKLKRRSRYTVYIFNVLLFVMIKFCGNQYWVLERNLFNKMFYEECVSGGGVSAGRGVTASSAAQRSLAWPEPGSVRTAGQLCHAQAGEYCTNAIQCNVLFRESATWSHWYFWLNDFMYSKVKCKQNIKVNWL